MQEEPYVSHGKTGDLGYLLVAEMVLKPESNNFLLVAGQMF